MPEGPVRALQSLQVRVVFLSLTIRTLLLEHPEGLTGKPYALALEFQLNGLERYPTERALAPLLTRQRSLAFLN